MVAVLAFIRPMATPMSRIVPAASCISAWMARTWRPISSVARPVATLSDLTSLATTAKPRPASPARAASIVALSARRLVLLRDGLDQRDDVADLAGARQQRAHVGVGVLRLRDRAVRHLHGGRDLVADGADRRGHVGRALGHEADVGGGFRRRARHVGRAVVGLRRDLEQPPAPRPSWLRPHRRARRLCAPTAVSKRPFKSCMCCMRSSLARCSASRSSASERTRTSPSRKIATAPAIAPISSRRKS